MKEYLLFDLDGTLTDPKVGITTCVQYALKFFGIEEPDLDRLEPFIGPPLEESFMNFYGMDKEQAKKAVEKYRERFSTTGLFENEVYRGIPEMLKYLKEKGMHLAVASSKPTVFVEQILDYFHIEKYFEVVVGSELDGTRVNKDEVVEEALKRLFQEKPIQRERIYMIGDRKFDVEGARAHDIECVAVAYGYGGIEELKEAKADYIVCTVEELKDFLLRDIWEAEYAQERNTSLAKMIWSLTYPFLMFLFVRTLVVNLLAIVCPEITGNVATVISAISYGIAALAIAPNARLLICKTAEETRLSRLKRKTLIDYGMLFWGTIASVVGLNLLFSLTGLTGGTESYREVVESQYSSSIVVGLLCYGLIAPLAEELLFRGALYNCMRRFMNIKAAIIISSAIFGVYHGNPVQAAYGFLMGCLIAYGYEYFGSFKIPVLMHAIANVLAYSFSYVPFQVGKLGSWLICVVSLIVAVGTVILLHRRRGF